MIDWVNCSNRKLISMHTDTLPSNPLFFVPFLSQPTTIEPTRSDPPWILGLGGCWSVSFELIRVWAPDLYRAWNQGDPVKPPIGQETMVCESTYYLGNGSQFVIPSKQTVGLR